MTNLCYLDERQPIAMQVQLVLKIFAYPIRYPTAKFMNAWHSQVRPLSDEKLISSLPIFMTKEIKMKSNKFYKVEILQVVRVNFR